MSPRKPKVTKQWFLVGELGGLWRSTKSAAARREAVRNGFRYVKLVEADPTAAAVVRAAVTYVKRASGGIVAAAQRSELEGAVARHLKRRAK